MPFAIIAERWEIATTLFIVAIISDMMDGRCARKWPYSKEEEARLVWRKIDHHMVDNIPDAAFFCATTFFLAIATGQWALYASMYVVLAFFLVLRTALVSKGKPTPAETVDVVWGWFFAGGLLVAFLHLAILAGWFHSDLQSIITIVLIVIIIIVLEGKRAISRPETRLDAERHRDMRQ